MLGDDGGCFSVALIECRPVRKHQPHRNIPVVRAVGGHVGPYFVVGEDAFLLQRLVGGLQMLAKILPEWFSLAGLDMEVNDTPYRSNIVVRTLRKSGKG